MIPTGMKFPNGLMAKGKSSKKLLRLFVLMIALITLLIIYGELSASGYGTDTTNITNNYPTTITSGISSGDLAQGLAMAMAAGGHQFDFAYNGLQGSITYAKQLDEEEQDAYSGALAYQFLDALDIKALGHVTFTPEQDDLGDYIIFGGTFRF